jgi:hypothetical protein
MLVPPATLCFPFSGSCAGLPTKTRIRSVFDEIWRGTMSPKTLMHSAEDEYQHKAVFIAEYEGVGGADYAIRTMQSERIIEWEFVTQAKDAGLVKKRNTVKGPAAFIQATTRATLHPENETRLLFVEVDESEEQTHAINERQAQAAAGQIKTASPEMFAEWHEFVSSLVPSEVLVPFAPELVPHFPSVRVRSRRDFPKLLGLVECSAFLHQHIRDRDEKNRIVAHPDDYAIAKELFEHCYYAGPEKDVALLLKAVEKLRAFFTHGDKTFAVSDIMKELRWGQTKAYQILNRALEVGCIADGDRRGQYRYIRGTTDSLLQLPTTVCRGTRDFS